MTAQEKQAEVERLQALVEEARAKPGVLRVRRVVGGYEAYASTKAKEGLVTHLESRLADVMRLKTEG